MGPILLKSMLGLIWKGKCLCKSTKVSGQSANRACMLHVVLLLLVSPLGYQDGQQSHGLVLEMVVLKLSTTWFVLQLVHCSVSADWAFLENRLHSIVLEAISSSLPLAKSGFPPNPVTLYEMVWLSPQEAGR